MSAGPTITVVIPSHHRLDRLPLLIETYVEQGADQVVVVLDGPHPGWSERLAGWVGDPVVQVRELTPHRGLALARIAGLEAATGDVVLLADDDVRPDPGLLDAHRNFHAGTPRSALLGYMPVDLPARTGRDQAATRIYAQDYENQVATWREASGRTILESFWGGNASLRRDLYLDAERHLPSVPLVYNEDLDLGLRLLEVGAEAAFDDRARAHHQHGRTLSAFRHECLNRGAAVFALEQRWPDLPHQLVGLVQVPATGGRVARLVQRHVASQDRTTVAERGLVLAYHLFGLVRLWPAQDAVARFLRRGLAIRGYRAAASESTSA